MLLVISRHGDLIGDEIFNKATSAGRVGSRCSFLAGVQLECGPRAHAGLEEPSKDECHCRTASARKPASPHGWVAFSRR